MNVYLQLLKANQKLVDAWLEPWDQLFKELTLSYLKFLHPPR